jgi:hypothetical protein
VKFRTEDVCDMLLSDLGSRYDPCNESLTLRKDAKKILPTFYIFRPIYKFSTADVKKN